MFWNHLFERVLKGHLATLVISLLIFTFVFACFLISSPYSCAISQHGHKKTPLRTFLLLSTAAYVQLLLLEPANFIVRSYVYWVGVIHHTLCYHSIMSNCHKALHVSRLFWLVLASHETSISNLQGCCKVGVSYWTIKMISKWFYQVEIVAKCPFKCIK